MTLPLKANDNGQVIDARGRVIAEFWTDDVPRKQAEANAEQYATLMNQQWEKEA